jgi:hypothetical protein
MSIIRLFNSYCTSIYGCELCGLYNTGVSVFCVTWRKALRRILGLPFKTHCFLLPLLSDTLPIFIELCKRSSRFIYSCINSPSQLVRSVAWHSVFVAKYGSVLGSNAVLCCERFGWSLEQFVGINGNLREWDTSEVS